MIMTTAAEAAREEIRRLERLLDEALHAFALYEEELNSELRGASEAKRAEVFARRAAYEQTLGVEALLEKIEELKSEIRRQG